MKFSIKDFFSKCDQIRRKLRIWSHLLNESVMENFIFCAVSVIKRISYSVLSSNFDSVILIADKKRKGRKCDDHRRCYFSDGR